MKRIIHRLNKQAVWVVMVVGILVFIPSFAYSQAIFRGSGWITAIDKEGSVEIGHKGYQVDSGARVLDGEGQVVSISKLPIPAYVHFLFKYTSVGPTVIRMKVDPNGRL